jgi:Asp/Glu/hydantoin racemase
MVVGMAGMERLVQEAVEEAGLPPVHVVDGGLAGVEVLAGLVRLTRRTPLRSRL